MAGNSIATDRSFIARDMLELDAFLHYRMVDVSSIKELARALVPAGLLPGAGQARWASGAGGHHRVDQRARLLPSRSLCARTGPDTATAKSDRERSSAEAPTGA